MKKRILAAILAAGMVMSLAACGGSGSSAGSSAGSAAASSKASESAASDSTAASSESAATSSSATAEAEDSSAPGSDAETDVMVAKEQIDKAADGLGDWEADYTDMAVSGDEEFTWGYIEMGYKVTFASKIRNTLVYYCEKNFPNVTVLTADGQSDANTQLQICENYIAQGVDCIILNPTDADGCVGVVETCRENNMPLVLVNSLVHTDLLDNGVGFVGSDNRQAGALEAQWILDNIDDTETVKMCYQYGEQGYDHTTLRYEGVFDTLDEAGFNYELVSSQISNFYRDKAMNNAEDWITAYGDEITVIPCCNDESAMGTLQAYQAADLADGVSILGIDANQDALQEVKKGTLAGTVFQNALGQAKWAAASAYDACVNGTLDTKGVQVPFELVDASNVDDYLE